MTKPPLRDRLIVTIDLISRGFGFAVLEGGERLIDWGVVQVRREKDRQCIRRVANLLDHYRPDLLVAEDIGTNRRRPARARNLLGAIQIVATEKRTRCRCISKDRMRLVFSGLGALTKHQIAMVVAERFPELAHRLPPPRKPWVSEADAMSIFTAVALAIAALSSRTR